jgi:TetR/AcrR family transcriptional regulator
VVTLKGNDRNGPKPTFLNLSEDKRRRIVRAALSEFAEKGYSKASVNAIVKATGIAKGSLYQYFNSKEQLFLYLFEDFLAHVKQAVKEAVDGSREGLFFEQIAAVFAAGQKFVASYPYYYQIYLRVLFEKEMPLRDRLLQRIRLFSADYFGPLCDRCKREGQIRDDIDTDQIIFIIDALLDRHLQDYAMQLATEEDTHSAAFPSSEETMEALVEILRHGLAK